jgi:hypothetical protein
MSRRLFVALLWIAVIPICIMSYQTYRAAQRALIESAFLHLSTIAEDHANHLDAWFQERVQDIGVLSRLPLVQDLCQRYCQMGSPMLAPEHLALLNYTIGLTQGRSPAYESVHIIGPTGAILASTDPDSEDLRFFMRAPVAERLRGGSKPAFSAVHQLRTIPGACISPPRCSGKTESR